MFKFSFIVVLQLIIYIGLICFFKFEFLGSFKSPLIVFISIIIAYFLFFKKNIFENICSFKKENMSLFIAGILILIFSIFLSKTLYYFEYSVFSHYSYDIPVLLPLILLFIYGYCFHFKHDSLPKYNIKYYLSCFIKAFYIPFLYGASVDVLDRFFVENYSHYTVNQFINFLFLFGVAFDVVVGLSGYIVSSKIFNNEIRDVNDQWLAWLFCFICYPPLLTLYRFYRTARSVYLD